MVENAIATGNLQKMIDLLAFARGDVNTIMPSGYPPLYYAANSNKLEILNYLLEKGADVNKSGR